MLRNISYTVFKYPNKEEFISIIKTPQQEDISCLRDPILGNSDKWKLSSDYSQQSKCALTGTY